MCFYCFLNVVYIVYLGNGCYSNNCQTMHSVLLYIFIRCNGMLIHTCNYYCQIMHTLKLVMIGPTESGKTTIANFLAEATEIPYDYRPTQGVRILEFEINDIEVNNERMSRDLELWDCSGNHKFKNCWPAIRKDVDGVILIYNAKMQDSSKKLKEYYDYFVSGAKLGPNSCVIFFFDPDNTTSSVSKIISSSFSNVSHVKCNVDDGGDKLKADFRLFLSALITKHEDKEEKLMSDNILFAK